MTKPPSFDRLLWKAADRIRDRLNPEKLSLSGLLLPETPWRDWRARLRRIGRARNRRWAAAEETVRREALAALTELSARLEDCRNVLAPYGDRSVVSSAGDIYRDLASLRDEFPKVAVEVANGSVSVTTEPIVLEGIHLGPFEIKLSWTEACTPLAYEVIAYIAAGLMTHQLTRWLRDIPVDADLTLNLLAAELVVE